EILKRNPGFYQFMMSINEADSLVEIPNPKWNAKPQITHIEDEEPVNILVSNPTDAQNHHQLITVVSMNDPDQKKHVVLEKHVRHEVVIKPKSNQTPESQLIRIVSNMAHEYEMSKSNVKGIFEVIDSQKIYTAIEKEFKKQGLPLDFTFATYCTDGDTLMMNKGSSADPLHEYEYKSPLLATDFIETGTLLL